MGGNYILGDIMESIYLPWKAVRCVKPIWDNTGASAFWNLEGFELMRSHLVLHFYGKLLESCEI